MRTLNLGFFAKKMFLVADHANRSNIIGLLPTDKIYAFLDIGCDDGNFTMQCAKKCCAVNTHGVEVVEQAASQASSRGVRVEISDLEQKLPYADNSFDLIMSNQVIEHVPSVDLFMSEIYRVLKTGGSAVISTENASSWVNIAASILGWQQFSLTNVSAKQGGIGNPFALHRNEVRIRSTWTHKTIFNYRGLIEFAEVHDLKVKKITGAGYFPLPNFFSRIDRRHSHFITILVCK